MRQDIPDSTPRRYWLLTLLSAAAAAVVSACKIAPVASPTRPPAPETPATVGPVAGPKESSARSSAATTPRAYRQDGASRPRQEEKKRCQQDSTEPECAPDTDALRRRRAS